MSAIGLIFTNHWVLTIGSTISPPRCERGTWVRYGLGLDRQSGSLHIGPQLLSTFEAIHARVRSTPQSLHLRIAIQHADDLQPVALPDGRSRLGRGRA